MEERTIESVETLDESDWNNGVACMASNGQIESVCESRATKDISVSYEDEPTKTFHTFLCDSCAAAYCKKWDKANTFGGDSIVTETFK